MRRPEAGAPPGRARRWLPAVMAAGMLAVLLGLGAWQLERAAWKGALIARLDARLAAPAVAWDDPSLRDPADAEFRRVRLTGRFLHDRALYLQARINAGQLGLHVVTPLALAGGGHVLVDRGWVPLAWRDPQVSPGGEVSLAGIVRLPPKPGPFTPENKPARNEWYTVDIPAMAAAAGLDPATMPPFYVAAEPMPGTTPAGVVSRPDLPDNHRQYAATWFGLAAVLVVVVGLYYRRKE